MLFFEMRFIFFFIIIYTLYIILQCLHKKDLQNFLLLIASYIFYGSWDWRFLSLIIISTMIDYFCGQGIGKTDNKRKRKVFLIISVVANLGILGFFKYSGFFVREFGHFINILGFQANMPVLNFILPAGISFYTFQTMSYTIDVYKGELEPQNSFLNFATFVSFFPQLVAGPIERATNLMNQIDNERQIELNKVIEGLRLYVWGVFKKIVIADNLAPIVDSIMVAPGEHSAWELLIAGTAFAFQIYGDFSGYSDMARGIARMMGFELMQNFNLPYFSKGIRDFWRRWHISLSTWLRDYVYIPLGGNRKGKLRTYINLNLTMLIGGFWHGASWNFILWGGYQGVLMTLERVLAPTRIGVKVREKFPGWLKIVLTFPLIVIGWLLFRVENDGQIITVIKVLFTNWNWTTIWDSIRALNFEALLSAIDMELGLRVIKITIILMIVQFIQYNTDDLEFDLHMPVTVRAILYVFVIYLILFGSAGVSAQFIYFQF